MFLEMFWQSTPIVKGVMITLVLMSIYSWTIILRKKTEIKKSLIELKFLESETKNELEAIKNSTPENYEENLMNFVRKNVQLASKCNKYGKIILTLRKSKYIKEHADGKMGSVLSSYIKHMSDEADLLIDVEVSKLRKDISSLANIGSVSPYIGLLGTVFGIVVSFMGIAETGKSTLEAVAPGISEALIATGIGLFAAIPAYIFYNIYVSKINEIEELYVNYKENIYNIYKECTFFSEIKESSKKEI